MATDLHNDDALKAACLDIETNLSAGNRQWRSTLGSFLAWVGRADEHERASLEFQQRLWEDNPVTTVGMGNINVAQALADADFRAWIARVSFEVLPDEVTSRSGRLEKIHRELLERASKYTNRAPRLKALRVMAALFPDDFTTIADRARLKVLHDAVCPPLRGTAVEHNVRIMVRLAEVLQPASSDSESEQRAARMTLPWLLHESLAVRDERATVEPTSNGGELRLRPLPAARRRKGLTAIGGTFQSMLAVLQEVEDGITREDLLDYLRGELPGSKTSSHGVFINVLMSEFGVIHREGELYKLTPAGEAVRETGDPDPLAEHLLTRILGVDHVLVHLKAHDAVPQREVLEMLQGVNPGWTKQFTPSAITSWLRAMDVIDKQDGVLSLSERGRAWAAQIHWTPEVFRVDDSLGALVPDVRDEMLIVETNVELPELERIAGAVCARGVFSPETVRDLHAGLGAHPRRHLAVLAGLSGTGKTLLAKEYGTALVGGEEAARTRLRIVPVQPGWYDPCDSSG